VCQRLPSVSAVLCDETATSSTLSHLVNISSGDLSDIGQKLSSLVLHEGGKTLLAELDLRNNDDSVGTGD